jgi:hypothetical protein
MPRRSARKPVAPKDPFEDAEGMELFRYLCIVFESVGDVVGRYERFGMFASSSEEWLREKYPDLQILRVRFSVEFSGHSGYCSDPDEDSEVYIENDQEHYVALPQVLVGHLSDIYDVSRFPVMEHSQCWCGGRVKSWRVSEIEVL